MKKGLKFIKNPIIIALGVIFGLSVYILITDVFVSKYSNDVSAEGVEKSEHAHAEKTDKSNETEGMTESDTNTNPDVLDAPEYSSIEEFIEESLSNLQSDSTNGAATSYDYDLHTVTSTATHAKHFAALTDSEEQIKKLNEIAEIGDLTFGAEPETVEERKQKMLTALSNF